MLIKDCKEGDRIRIEVDNIPNGYKIKQAIIATVVNLDSYDMAIIAWKKEDDPGSSTSFSVNYLGEVAKGLDRGFYIEHFRECSLIPLEKARKIKQSTPFPFLFGCIAAGAVLSKLTKTDTDQVKGSLNEQPQQNHNR